MHGTVDLVGGGRFIEMGKTDLRDPEAVAQQHPGVNVLPGIRSDRGRARVHRDNALRLDGDVRHQRVEAAARQGV